MNKQYGIISVQDRMRLKRQLEEARLKKFLLKKNPNPQTPNLADDPFYGRGNREIRPVHNKKPFEAVLTNDNHWNPFEHKHPSEIFDDDFSSHDGVFLTLFDCDKGTKSKGRTGNLFGF